MGLPIEYRLNSDALAPVAQLAHFVSDPRGLSIEPRFIEDFELVYIVSGEGVYRFLDLEIPYRSGSLILTPPYLEHSYRSVGKAVDHYALHFDPRLGLSSSFRGMLGLAAQASEVSIIYNDSARLAFHYPDFDGRALDRFERITRLHRELSLGAYASSPLLMASSILELLALVVASSAGEERLGSRRFAASAARLDERFTERATIPELAALEGYSPNYYASEFAKAYGVSPIDYLHAKRIALAKELLASTRDSIGSIASACGYEDPYYFSKVFKKLTRLSPRAYRSLIAPRE